MNQRQIALIWVMGIVTGIWSLWGVSLIIRNIRDIDALLQTIPPIMKVNFFFVLPVIVVTSIMIYIVRDKG